MERHPPGPRPFSDTVAAIMIGLVAVLLLGCVVRSVFFALNPFRGRGVLLEMTEGPARIWLADRGSFDVTLELHVDGPAGHRSVYAIDKSTYSTLRFVRHGGRVLVANGPFVFAAYDPATDRIIGYNELPFTVWEGQGEVVDSYRFSSDPPSMRAGFPEVRERRAEPTPKN